MSDNGHRISKAPPPPTFRLSGTGGGPSKPRYQAQIAPDWSFWPASRSVAPWQAVALSLNLDPDSLKHEPHGWMAGPGAPPFFLSEGFPDAETEAAFKKRSGLLASYRPSHSGLLPLQDFATWAASVNLAPIPPELAARANAVQDTAQTTEAPPATWEAMTLEQKRAAWNVMSAQTRREKAAELVRKHGGNKTAAGAEVGITGNRMGQLLKETEGQPEAPLPVNKWTQAAGLAKPKRGKASR